MCNLQELGPHLTEDGSNTSIPSSEYQIKNFLLKNVEGSVDYNTCSVYEACKCGMYVWDTGDYTALCPICPPPSRKHPQKDRVTFIVNDIDKWLKAQYANAAMAKTLHDFAEAKPIVGDYMAHGGFRNIQFIKLVKITIIMSK